MRHALSLSFTTREPRFFRLQNVGCWEPPQETPVREQGVVLTLKASLANETERVIRGDNIVSLSVPRHLMAYESDMSRISSYGLEIKDRGTREIRFFRQVQAKTLPGDELLLKVPVFISDAWFSRARCGQLTDAIELRVEAKFYEEDELITSIALDLRERFREMENLTRDKHEDLQLRGSTP